MRVCLTGGAGFIGSHILVGLLNDGHEVLVIDNFVNSSPKSLDQVRTIAVSSFEVLEQDICHHDALSAALSSFRPDIVIHCAGLKAVGESQEQPLRYYRTNVEGSISLLEAMDEASCQRIIFSSSATVYGTPRYLPYDEAHPVAPVNVYGRTKAMIEDIITDWAATDPRRSAALLRYFNPVGAHESGEIGEDPKGIPNNLVPYIADVATGTRPELAIFGDDYDTRDGTGVRDYIHITDLADGHIAAMAYLANHQGVEVFNLGTGEGSSVLEVVAAFRRASNRPVPYAIKPRRDGDIAEFFANPAKANERLGWRTSRTLDAMCADVWRWRSRDPNGFDG
ncbi:MAG: UDP-glucose 4-epimerase GalE [Rhodobiaceae bacterium]